MEIAVAMMGGGGTGRGWRYPSKKNERRARAQPAIEQLYALPLSLTEAQLLLSKKDPKLQKLTLSPTRETCGERG